MTTKAQFLKLFAVTLLIALLNQILFPLTAYALTSGPSQPEVQSFSPASTSEMVDLFTGDFKYNLPLMEVGGYPVSLSYNAGIQMDQEASWVGLGWNLNVGAILRNLRGLPDEFNGTDQVKRHRDMRPNRTWGVSLSRNFEIAGLNYTKPPAGSNQAAEFNQYLNGGFSMLLQHNNYTGFDMGLSLNPAIGSTDLAKTKWNASLGINVSARQGTAVRPQFGFSGLGEKRKKLALGQNLSLTTAINSRSGLRQLNLTAAKNQAFKSGDRRLNLPSWSQGVQLAHPTYTPGTDFPMRTISTSFRVQGFKGLPGWISNNDLVITGFYSQQEFQKNNITSSAYGYLNLHKGKDDREASLDFVRENDGGLRKETPHLPLTNLTYDTYAVSGQGVAGAFRAYRGDVGAVFDRANTISSNGVLNAGLQTNVGSNNVVGLDWMPALMSGGNGKWIDQNELLPKVNYVEANPASALYQPATFRMLGEQVQMDSDFFAERGGLDPVRPRLSGALGVSAQAAWTTGLSDAAADAVPVNAPVLRDQRRPGNAAISVLAAREAAVGGLEKTLQSYAVNGNLASATTLNRADAAAGRKDHHPSEFTVLGEGGNRYVYGIPAYNRVQKDVSFSVGKSALNATALPYNGGEIDYVSYYNATAQAIEPAGQDGFIDETEVDPYAHSYLLTAYLSSDYEDRTGDGPSGDDIGSYVKFNYSRDQASYRWRAPYEQWRAKHNPGLRGDPTDDQASYSYGEKEIWYLHSIESRDYVAFFVLSDRKDGHGVMGEHGGIDPNMNLRKLNRIDLFARREYLNPPTGQAPVPIQSVHFEYDYSLCPSVPNNDNSPASAQENELANQGGKLTLKRIYFTHYNSTKGKMNNYVFHYGGLNPAYNPQENDRWGMYTPSLSNNQDELKNVDYPYVVQDKALVDSYASAWCLTAVDLPSGGRMEVEYEADDYAHVQNRRAMRMMTITGLSNLPDDATASARSILYDPASNAQYSYLYFDLEEPIPQRTGDDRDDERFYQDYIHDLGQYLYFRCLVEWNALAWAPRPGEHEEFVRGYAELERADGRIVAGLDNASVNGNGAYTRGWIKVRLESVQDQDQGSGLQVHPIAKATWDQMVLQQNHLVYRGSTAYDPAQAGFEGAMRGMLGFFRDIFLVFSSRNRWMYNQQKYGQNIDKTQSFIRLPDPNRVKYGGGHRVKRILMYDNWDEMTGTTGTDFRYGKIYEYTVAEAIPDLNQPDADMTRRISSGVAAYEPIIGGDENPFRQPVRYEQSNFLAADERFLQEEPLGESMFPAPTVGYRQITVRNLPHANVRKNATGYAVHEFYTAKDFPTRVRDTGPRKRRSTSRFIPAFFKAGMTDFMTAAEGFVVERNDMHGKPKAIFAYPEPDPNAPPHKLVAREISGTRYFYRTRGELRDTLDNRVLVIRPDGTVAEAEMGLTLDMVTDMREYKTASVAVDLRAQIDFQPNAPAPIVSSIPGLTLERTRFRSAVATKVIDRSAILEKIVQYDRQAQIPTEHLAYDSETGQVLLSRTWNEYKQPIYDLIYPAHWIYGGMGLAYPRLEYQKTGLEFDPGNGAAINAGSDAVHFAVGDEVLLKRNGIGLYLGPYWVSHIAGNNLYLVDRAGNQVNSGNSTGAQFDLKIIRSIQRNLAGTAAGSVQFLENSPLVNNVLDVNAQKDWVLSSAAAEFSDDWKMLLNPDYPGVAGCSWLDLLGPLANSANTFGYPVGVGCGYNYEGVVTPPASAALILEFYDCDGNLFFNQTIPLNLTVPCPNGNLFLSNLAVVPDPNDPNRSLVSFELNCPAMPTPVVYGPISWPNPALCSSGNTRFPNTTACDSVGDVVNPWVQGLRGHWRALRTHAFLEDRAYVDANRPRLREDGVLADFVPFWRYSSGVQRWYGDKDAGNPFAGTPNARWQYTQQAEEFHPRGLEVESSDPIVTYAGAILGYDQSLVAAMGQNAEYRQLAFDGFEDYVLRDATANQCELFHWDFVQYSGQMSTDAAHSGFRSLKVEGNFPTVRSEVFAQSSGGGLNGNQEYVTGWDDRLDLFEPTAGDYVLLAWTRQEDTGSDIPPLRADRSRMLLYFTDGDGNAVGATETIGSKGTMIDGWQRIEHEFAVPDLPLGANGPLNVFVRFANTGPAQGPVYFDDVRISPKDAIVKSYVYHPYNRRLMAELDANHYATFYEYDEDGALIRVKKETERGIHTVQESRTSLRKVSFN
ncbi:MAG: hypothetical protein AAF998_22670 [Bacteroidota bacterium]